MAVFLVFYLRHSVLENLMFFFCTSLKVFPSEIGISLYAQIYKFHVSELSQPLHWYTWAAVAIFFTVKLIPA
jgi:phosphatidylserine decarboxylase